MSLLCVIKLIFLLQFVWGVRETFLESCSVVFGAPALNWRISWPQISAILLPAALKNCIMLAKYVATLSNQIYLPITTRFGGQRDVFGELFSSFSSSNPKIGHFLAPNINYFASCSFEKLSNAGEICRYFV